MGAFSTLANAWYIPIIIIILFFIIGFSVGFMNGWRTATFFAIWNILALVVSTLVVWFAFESLFNLIWGNVASKLLNPSFQFGPLDKDIIMRGGIPSSIRSGFAVLVYASFIIIFNFLGLIFYLPLRKKIRKVSKALKLQTSSKIIGGTIGSLIALPSSLFLSTALAFFSLSPTTTINSISISNSSNSSGSQLSLQDKLFATNDSTQSTRQSTGTKKTRVVTSQEIMEGMLDNFSQVMSFGKIAMKSPVTKKTFGITGTDSLQSLSLSLLTLQKLNPLAHMSMLLDFTKENLYDKEGITRTLNENREFFQTLFRNVFVIGGFSTIFEKKISALPKAEVINAKLGRLDKPISLDNYTFKNLATTLQEDIYRNSSTEEITTWLHDLQGSNKVKLFI